MIEEFNVDLVWSQRTFCVKFFICSSRKSYSYKDFVVLTEIQYDFTILNHIEFEDWSKLNFMKILFLEESQINHGTKED